MSAGPRRRMSRHIRLVLIGGLPGLLGCAGCCGCGGTTTPETPSEPMEEVEEVNEDPPPDGPEYLIGAPFVGWWQATHPPVVTYRIVPRSVVERSGYTRSSSGIYQRTYYGGRSGYLFGGSSGPAHSGGAVRGGFGSTGHAASGGS